MKKAITIKDIAEQLELSRNTVAKALNGQYVPAKTRELVIAKARELNYKSIGTPLSDSDSAGQKRILLFSGKPLTNLKFFTPIMRGLENFCYNSGHELFQYTFKSDTMTFSTLSEHIKSLDADGIIAIETFDKEFIAKLINLGLPICFIDFTATSVPISGNFDIVEPDNTRPIYTLTRQLHRQYGTTRFCFVGDYTHCLSFEERYFGMIQALAMDGIDHSQRDDIVRSDNFNYGSPAAIKSEILKLRNMPECFICSNDFIARSVCNALKSMNISIPDRCMVTGFDNVSYATASEPGITTFGVDKEYIGAEAVRTLIYRVENPSVPTRKITVRSKPMVRASTQR